MNYPSRWRVAYLVAFLAGLALSATVCKAQTERPDVQLSWGHPDSSPVVTFDVERAPLDCGTAANTDFQKLNTAPITEKGYLDQDRAPGRYCYRAFAVAGGLRSDPSNRASADVPPAPPSDLSGNIIFAFDVKPDGSLSAKLIWKQKRTE